VLALTLFVVIVKLAEVEPAAIETLDGTVAALVLLLESETVTPPDGAAAVSVTLPVDDVPPVTLVGLTDNELRAAFVVVAAAFTVRAAVFVTPL
jgi:hypothetical protein